MPPPGGWRDDVADLPGLNPDFRLRFEYYREDVYRRTGIAIGIADGYRSTALQIERRIQNCGGNTHYNIWLKPSSQCRPPTAKPGTSKHEKGQAIDQTPHYTAHWYIREAANKAGLEFDVPSEAWHIVPKWSNNKPCPSLADLPRIFGFTLGQAPDPPPPAPDDRRKFMARYASTVNKDGREEEFMLDDEGRLLSSWAPSVGATPGPWTTDLRKDANGNQPPPAQEVSAGRDDIGRIYVALHIGFGIVWRRFQTTPGGPWSYWQLWDKRKIQ